MRQRHIAISIVLVAGFAGSAAAGPPGDRDAQPGSASGLSAPASSLELAMRVVASESPSPNEQLDWLRYKIRHDPVEHAARDQAAWEAVLRTFGPAPIGGLVEFAATEGAVWVGDGEQGPPGRALPASLTYSFADDSVAWGAPEAFLPAGPNDLNTQLATLFGPFNLDLGREYIRQGIAAWRRFNGVSYSEVSDDDSPMDQSPDHLASRGDIRIGGSYVFDAGAVAYNGFPAANILPGVTSVGGGDMFINTFFFRNGSILGDPADSFRFLRAIVAHEHGHGLGLRHVGPINATKLMEPGAFTIDQVGEPRVDDIRGVGRLNGDALAGDQSPDAAFDLGELGPIDARALRNLSTNGADGFAGSGQDWLRFTLTAPASVAISVSPRGGVYPNTDFLNDETLVNADQAGDLVVELRDGAGVDTLAESSQAPPGGAEHIGPVALDAGVYTIRIADTGPNPPVNQVVQLYDIEIRTGGGLAPPVAIAGLCKQVAASTPCFFMGDINSYAAEHGASIVRYDWDLDGDGAFETLDEPRPAVVYDSVGVRDVTLRVTDSNGLSALDTIEVDVVETPVRLTQIQPAHANAGQRVMVTLFGTNLGGLTSAGQVSVTGIAGGVEIAGTPTPNDDGSVVTGLTFHVSSGAIIGRRTIRVDTPDGSSTAVGVFFARGAPLPGDTDGDGHVDSVDLATVIVEFGACQPGLDCSGDLNGDGVVDGVDLAIVLASWTG